MNRILLLFFLIFCLSASFRVTNLNLIEFKTDEAVNLLLAMRPQLGHGLTPGGTVSSIGILNPPLFNYLLTPIVSINWEPRFVTFVIAMINSAAVAFFFLIIRRYYNLNIALISSILFALSPWAILYSRKIWMQDLLIPFFLLVFYSIHKLLIDKKKIYWLPYVAGSLALIQLHQITIIFIVILTLFLIKKTKFNLKFSILGFAIGILPLIPYLLFQYLNSCPDCQAFLEAKNRLSPNFSLEIFLKPLQITNQGGLRFVMGEDTLTFAKMHPLADSLRKVFYLEYLLLPLGIILFIRKFKNLNFLGLSVITLTLLYFILKIEPFTHYYIVILPLLFLFLGVAINSLPYKLKLLVLFLLIFVSLIFNYSFFDLLSKRGGLNGDYGQVYYLSKEEKDKRVADLEDISYKEAFLESFIPLNYTFGFEPLGRILYSDVANNQIPFLEEKLKKEPENQKVKHQLMAYHTKQEPTIETLDFLYKKSQDLPSYEPIYKEVHRYFTSSNFKKEFVYTSGGIRFFYPEHWKVNEFEDEIIIFEENFGLTIYKEKTNQKVFETNLINIGSLKVGYIEKKISEGKQREERIKTLDDIVKSIRPL